MQGQAALPAQAEEESPPIDLHTLLAQFIALRHEVHLQTRATRAQQEQNAETLRQLTETMDALRIQQAQARETQTQAQEEVARPLLKTLVDLHDALTLAEREVRRAQENILPILEEITASLCEVSLEEELDIVTPARSASDTQARSVSDGISELDEDEEEVKSSLVGELSELLKWADVEEKVKPETMPSPESSSEETTVPEVVLAAETAPTPEEPPRDETASPPAETPPEPEQPQNSEPKPEEPAPAPLSFSARLFGRGWSVRQPQTAEETPPPPPVKAPEPALPSVPQPHIWTPQVETDPEILIPPVLPRSEPLPGEVQTKIESLGQTHLPESGPLTPPPLPDPETLQPPLPPEPEEQPPQVPLEVIDRARQMLASVVTGYTMSVQRVDRALRQQGLEPIPTVGQPFDPERMEVLEVVPAGECLPGEVADEIRRGYLWRGRVFRFAQVRVAR